jgi:polygalacturonase
MRKIRIIACVLIFSYLNVNCQIFNILKFGAIADNKILNTKSIQAAIDTCSNAGGGTVYVPSGIFITGTIELKSNVNLYLESGAELKGSPDITNYKSYNLPGYGTFHYGILFASNARNLSITGQGAINGNEEVFFDWSKAKIIEWGGSQFTRQKEKIRAVNQGIGDGPVVPDNNRPRQMVIFSACSNVLIRDVQLNKSPFWTLHLADCDGAVISGVKIWASLLTPNSDGMDITSCNNVIVSDCDIRTGDDAIAITGYSHHLELPGFINMRHPSENITITNCNLQSRSSGIRIGSLDQNTIRNIHISNINITNSNRGIGIFIRDEGSVENITISQVSIETRLHTGDWWGNGEPIHISAVRGNADVPLGQLKNVTFRDITCTGENGILIYGSDESVIEQVRFENLRLFIKDSELNKSTGGNIDLRGALLDKQLFSADISGFYAQHVNGLMMNDVIIKWDDVKEEYFKYGIHIKNSGNISLSDIEAKPSPSNSSLAPVMIENCSNIKAKNKDLRFSKASIIK